jgi:hypothetical protein|tara:strand:+ start:575 stop:787 length:213 start_codon:yes stop_codon:yes gene_type:complete
MVTVIVIMMEEMKDRLNQFHLEVAPEKPSYSNLACLHNLKQTPEEKGRPHLIFWGSRITAHGVGMESVFA